jgi:hypothetical protein
MSRLPVLALLLVVAASAPACQSGAEDDAGQCPAAVLRAGDLYHADSRFGTPPVRGRPVDGVSTTACGEARERPVEAFAIPGIPTSVAIYAPAAYGEEFIMVRDGERLTDVQVAKLERADS